MEGRTCEMAAFLCPKKERKKKEKKILVTKQRISHFKILHSTYTISTSMVI
jgi:hypothetical protein